MTSPKIALFANPNNAQIEFLRDILREEGATPIVLTNQIGGEAAPTVVVEGDYLSWEGVDFADIQAIHVRCPSLNVPSTLPAVMHAASYSELRSIFLREQEYQSVASSFCERLVSQGKLVVNPPGGQAYRDHDSKAQLYQKLRAWGFCVPRSLMTNDPERAYTFIADVGKAVAKPSMHVGATRQVTPADMERLEELKICPVLLQEFIKGPTLRVLIVGDSVVLTLRIQSAEGYTDSRSKILGFEPYQLPEEEAAKIVQANRRLGLHYASWDVLAAEDGRYVYLDCNPGTYMMWLGEENVRRVFTQLSRYMISFANTGSVEEASRSVTEWRLPN